MRKDAVTGSLLGCYVGDSIGLVYEGIYPERQKKMYKDIGKQRMLFGKGVISDDTEHLLFTTAALCNSAGDEEIFRNLMAKSLKKWFLTLPYGIGMATLKASVRLIMGVSPERSGVKSAGNGPAMRSGIIGICYGDNPEKMKRLVKISTQITHIDERAETGAIIIAAAAYLSSQEENVKPKEFNEKCREILKDYGNCEMLNLLNEVIESINADESTAEFCKRMYGFKGISGYICHTVPAVIHCWLRNQDDFSKALTEIIRCGGDTDTTAAILGTIIGARGNVKISDKWKDNVIAFPYSQKYIEEIGEALYKTVNGMGTKIKEPLFILALLRNLSLYPVILYYGFRRFFPPY